MTRSLVNRLRTWGPVRVGLIGLAVALAIVLAAIGVLSLFERQSPAAVSGTFVAADPGVRGLVLDYVDDEGVGFLSGEVSVERVYIRPNSGMVRLELCGSELLADIERSRAPASSDHQFEIGILHGNALVIESSTGDLLDLRLISGPGEHSVLASAGSAPDPQELWLTRRVLDDEPGFTIELPQTPQAIRLQIDEPALSMTVIEGTSGDDDHCEYLYVVPRVYTQAKHHTSNDLPTAAAQTFTFVPESIVLSGIDRGSFLSGRTTDLVVHNASAQLLLRGDEQFNNSFPIGAIVMEFAGYGSFRLAPDGVLRVNGSANSVRIDGVQRVSNARLSWLPSADNVISNAIAAAVGALTGALTAAYLTRRSGPLR